MAFSLGYIGIAFLTNYGTATLGMPRTEVLAAGMFGNFVNCLAIISGGILSDRYGRRRVLLTANIVGIPWALVLFPLLDTGSLGAFWLGQGVTFLIAGTGFGVAGSFLSELFHTRYRYTAAGLAYSFAGVLGGAIPPLVAASLIGTYGGFVFGILLAGYCLLGLLCTLALRETRGRELVEVAATAGSGGMTLTIAAVSVGRVFGLPKPALTYFRGWGETLDISLVMFVIQGGDAPVVVDTGADPGRSWEHHRIRMEQTPEERPAAALHALGVDPADVAVVVNTHLHWDHSSNNHLFPNARVVIQQREIDYARHPASWHRRQFEHLPGLAAAWLSAEDRIDPVDGDAEVAPGISVVTLPGHTPGSQGVVVEAAAKRYLIAGDCVDLYENWAGDDEAEHIPSGLFTDIVAYEESMRRIEKLGCEVIPSHDPLVVERREFR